MVLVFSYGLQISCMYQHIKLVVDNKVDFFSLLDGALPGDSGQLCPEQFPFPFCGAGLELPGSSSVHPAAGFWQISLSFVLTHC